MTTEKRWVDLSGIQHTPYGDFLADLYYRNNKPFLAQKQEPESRPVDSDQAEFDDLCRRTRERVGLYALPKCLAEYTASFSVPHKPKDPQEEFKPSLQDALAVVLILEGRLDNEPALLYIADGGNGIRYENNHEWRCADWPICSAGSGLQVLIHEVSKSQTITKELMATYERIKTPDMEKLVEVASVMVRTPGFIKKFTTINRWTRDRTEWYLTATWLPEQRVNMLRQIAAEWQG